MREIDPHEQNPVAIVQSVEQDLADRAINTIFECQITLQNLAMASGLGQHPNLVRRISEARATVQTKLLVLHIDRLVETSENYLKASGRNMIMAIMIAFVAACATVIIAINGSKPIIINNVLPAIPTVIPTRTLTPQEMVTPQSQVLSDHNPL